MICLSKQLLHVLNTRHKQQEDKQIEKMRRLVVHLNEHIFGQKYLLERKEWYRLLGITHKDKQQRTLRTLKKNRENYE
jgi:hypothetical protein